MDDDNFVVSESCSKVVCTLAGTSVFDGLALNIEQRKLYYSDAGYGRVGELSMDGTGGCVILEDADSEPRAIIYDEQNRYLLLTSFLLPCV